MDVELIDIVQGYLAEHPNISQANFLKRADVNEKAITRLKAGRNVTPEVAFKLLCQVFHNNYLKVYTELKRLYPNPKYAWIDAALRSIQENEVNVPPDPQINAIMQRSPSSQNLIHLLSSKIGTSRGRIQQLFGEVGVYQVEEMIEEGKVIVLESGAIRLKEYNIAFFPETQKSIALNNGVTYNTATFSTPESMIGTVLGFSSPTGCDVIKGILVKAHEDVVAAKNAYPGFVPIVVSQTLVKPFGDAQEKPDNLN